MDVHGKHLFLRFEGELTVHSHLRMTGAWAVASRRRAVAALAWRVPGSCCAGGGREVVQFDGPVLELTGDRRLRRDPRLLALGQDVLAEELDHELFLRRLRCDDPARPIGEALLDQRTVAGIGNLWKSECCFALGVDPWRAVREVGDDEALGVLGFVRERMRVAVADGALRPAPRRLPAGGPALPSLPDADPPTRAGGEQSPDILVSELSALSLTAAPRASVQPSAGPSRCGPRGSAEDRGSGRRRSSRPLSAVTA